MFSQSTPALATADVKPDDGKRASIFKDVDAATFDERVRNRKDGSVVLVDFSAVWCGPCKFLTPILERVSGKSGVDLVVVDVDNQPSIAAEYKVRAMPTVMAFKDGQPVGQFVGALPEQQVQKFVDTHSPSMEGSK